MAEDKVATRENKPHAQETAELEAMLDGKANPGESPTGRQRGLPWGWLAAGGLLIGGLVFADQFLFTPALSPPEQPSSLAPTGGEAPAVAPAATTAPAKTAPVKKGRVYSLQPFFLPLTQNGKETGRYIRMTPSFLVSEDFNEKEMDITLPLIRKNIYNILRRKEAPEYQGDTNPIKETIKKEILATANASLRKGSGSINDVYYEQFLIK
jgi:flagellar basal body-associated protein FliL